ncbi:hypothetical protein Bbelb_412850 [Branchiostoma belcheri]|nr:hypothetical protein Bbelb_412850 [Branchiostoma belcheri]
MSLPSPLLLHPYIWWGAAGPLANRVIIPPESPGNESTCLIAAQAALPRLQPPASPTCCKPTPIVDMLQQQSQLAGQLLLPCTQPSLAATTEHRAQHLATCTRTQASV